MTKPRNPRETRASFRARHTELAELNARAASGHAYSVTVPPGLTLSDHLRALLGLDARRNPGEHANDCACHACLTETWGPTMPRGGHE